MLHETLIGKCGDNKGAGHLETGLIGRLTQTGHLATAGSRLVLMNGFKG